MEIIEINFHEFTITTDKAKMDIVAIHHFLSKYSTWSENIPYRDAFFETIKSFSSADFSTVEINRSEKGQIRKLGDYLQRIAYHESVHTGQMLVYFRLLGLERPSMWD